MSDNKEEIVKENQKIKLCTECHKNPPMSKGGAFCASCMAKKANNKRKQATGMTVKAPNLEKTGEDKGEKGQVEKPPCGVNMKVVIDFNKYPHIFKQVQELADDEMRVFDAQIIFLLKRHFDTVKETLKAV